MSLKPVLFAGAAGMVLALGGHVMATSASADDPVESPVLAMLNSQLRAKGVTNVMIDKAELIVHAAIRSEGDHERGICRRRSYTSRERQRGVLSYLGE